jgi:hypothetical protein
LTNILTVIAGQKREARLLSEMTRQSIRVFEE